MNVDNLILSLVLRLKGLTKDQIYYWGISASTNRIYVPIYYKGVLEQYIGRRWRNDLPPKYLYGKGKPVTDFFFGWDEQDWSWMTLVENTFVAIALREDINCTTTSGLIYQMNK